MNEIANRVMWIDKPRYNKNASTNAAALFELLFLLKNIFLPDTDFDRSIHNKNNFYRKIECCFCDSNGQTIKNLKSKNTSSKVLGNTPRAKLLASVIQEGLPIK